MSKQIILTLSEGNFEQGFAALLRIQDDKRISLCEISGKLPGSESVEKSFNKWQECFHRKVAQIPSEEQFRGKPLGVTKFQNRSDAKNAASLLVKEINNWLNTADETWKTIRRSILNNLNEQEEIRVIIQSSNMVLWRLPWQTWDIFCQHCPNAEIGLSPTEGRYLPFTTQKQAGIRILAVLGMSQGVNIDFDRKVLNSLCSRKAKIEFLNQPAKAELCDRLWNRQGWDVFFFAGHSETINGEIGHIYLNRDEKLEIGELKNSLDTAIKHGLQIGIFNSCDGLGLANQLGKLHLPHCIVMKEPVPDPVAKLFLKDFLTEFAGGSSFYASVRKARGKLEDTWHEKYPGISWLPVICQNMTMKQPTWNELQKRRPGWTDTIKPCIRNMQWRKRTGTAVLAILFLTLISALIAPYVRIFSTNAFEERTEPLTGMKFVRVPGGCYEMGCNTKEDDNCSPCETPLHKVCLDSFRIGKYQVTQAQWKIIMGNNPSAHKNDDMPVEMASWKDTQEFIENLKNKTGQDYRLPTEAEWEYLCKYEKSHGVSEINGINRDVGEWCEDVFTADAYSRHTRNNPVIRDMSGKSRVVRGITIYGLKEMPCTFRSGRPPERQNSDVGFRIVKIANGS
ncbi:MAG: SUMF1/EgtB/PvdO family nonheme iron enzyme [Desulfobacterales bacterium]|nr:SUMF1/EgtB/PvdO family nonheme iron enzyme [Desulfobacterales bacterium]